MFFAFPGESIHDDGPNDLSRLQRDDADRPGRGRDDAAVPARTLRKSLQHPPFRRQGADRGRGGPPPGGSPGRRATGRDRPDQRRLRVQQHGDPGRRPAVPIEGPAHHHVRGRAPGRSRTVRRTGPGRLPDHDPPGGRRRACGSSGRGRGDHTRDDPDHRHACQQRSGDDPADRCDLRDRARAGSPLAHRRRAVGREDPGRRERTGRGLPQPGRPQALRSEGCRRLVRSLRGRTTQNDARRRTRIGPAGGDRERPRDRRSREGLRTGPAIARREPGSLPGDARSPVGWTVDGTRRSTLQRRRRRWPSQHTQRRLSRRGSEHATRRDRGPRGGIGRCGLSRGGYRPVDGARSDEGADGVRDGHGALLRGT